MVKILTSKEKEIIKKKLSGVRLSQNESNILSKSIRPKLKEAEKLNPRVILNKIEYRQKAKPLEEKIKKIILDILPKTDSIILCGSAIQSNYGEYNDIDIIIVTKTILEKKTKENAIRKLEEQGKIQGLNLDVQIYSKKSIIEQYPKNPSLIYQLKDSKAIYGKLKTPKKISISPLDLRMKLDWSEADSDSDSEEIYYAIRNALLVSLLMEKKVDNNKLKTSLAAAIGKNLSEKLKTNTASKIEKKLALAYLKLLIQNLETELKNAKWEKIELENL